MDVEWMASELARGLDTQPASAPNDWTLECAVFWEPVHGRVAVTSSHWQIDIWREGEGFAVAYDGDFDLCAARACALVRRLESIFTSLSLAERERLWAERQRLAPEGRRSAP